MPACSPLPGPPPPVIYTHRLVLFVRTETVTRLTLTFSCHPDGLAKSRNAPSIFLKTSKSGLPYISVIFCALFTLLAFMAADANAGTVFTWFSGMTAVAGLMTWFGISVTYIRFYKGLQAQNIPRKSLPFYSRFQPYAAWYGAISTLIICFVRLSLSFSLPLLTRLSPRYSSADGKSSSMVNGTPPPS